MEGVDVRNYVVHRPGLYDHRSSRVKIGALGADDGRKYLRLPRPTG